MSRTRGMRVLRACAALAAAGLTAGAAMATADPAMATADPARAGSLLGAPVISEHDAVAASGGIYRIPLADGAIVTVAEEPSSPALSLGAEAGTAVVAASTGWIRGLRDDAAPGMDWVWVEHAGGEYSKYAAFDLAAGFGVGDPVAAGDAIGRTVAPGLVWEVVVPATAPLGWSAEDGAAADAARVAPRVCDAPGGELRPGRHLAGACRHTAPAAVLAPGPIVVDEGSPVTIDGSASVDPDGAPLIHRWTLAPWDLPSEPEVEFVPADDFRGVVSLTVHDQVEGLADTVSRDVVVRNVPPTVSAVATGAAEGGVGTVRATVTDPGADALSAGIDWGDGTPAQPVAIEQLEAGVDHGYGDDGDYPVVVTVVDDDGGVGAHAVAMRIDSVAPEVRLEVGGSVALPGGEYAVLAAGADAQATARATDPGSDDLVFSWSNGRGRTFLRDGSGHDAPLSPSGSVPVSAATGTELPALVPGVQTLRLVVADDDGGRTEASVRVLVTGTDAATRSRSRWIQELSGTATELPAVVTAAYLQVIGAASAVFPEEAAAGTPAEAAAVLSPRIDDARTQARAELLCAWLHFASGAVRWDASVPGPTGAPVTLGDLMTEAELTISSPTATDSVLREVGAALSRTAGPRG